MFYTAIVVGNQDPDKEGKIEVYSETLQIKMKKMDSEVKKEQFRPKIKLANNDVDYNYLNPKGGSINTKGTITARPSFLIEESHGQFLVPEIGDEINIFFRDEDYSMCFYAYLGPYKRAKLMNFGKIIEDEQSYKDYTEKQNLRVLLLTKSGHIIAFNDTEVKNGVLFKTGNGHKLKMEKNDTMNAITLITENGHKIFLDDMNKGIKIETVDKHTISLDDGDNKGIVVKTTAGYRLVLDDKNKEIQLNTPNGNGLLIDDKNNTISVNSNKDFIAYVPNYTVFNSPNIRLGSNNSNQSFILGEKFMEYFNNHIHWHGDPKTGVPVSPFTDSLLSKVTKST